MLQFLNPIWLFAAAAAVIPVVIHLWNIRPGRVLKVGSISLINAASRKSSRSFKLLDIPLLILRCLLLLLTALLLAVPVWQKKAETDKAKGWLLIPKENLLECSKKFTSQIDSLIKAGYDFHYFNPGFSKVDLKQVLLHPNDSLKISNTTTLPINYWNLIRQLDTKVAASLPVYVITPNRINNFRGAKPQVAMNMHWHTYTPADSTSVWISNAWFNNSNNICVVTGISKPSGTTYNFTTVESTDLPGSSFVVSTNNGQPAISFKHGIQPPVKIDTATMHIAVYADNNTNDAGYLKAALYAASQFIQHKTLIKQFTNPKDIPANQNWLFWLSEKPVNADLKGCRNILFYKKGRVVNSDSWMVHGDTFAVPSGQEQKIDLFKTIASPATDNTVVWHDGFGHPVLDLQKHGPNNIYSFYSRFNPSWNDLVWSDKFPAWILKLVNPETNVKTINKYDKRTIAKQQLTPEKINETSVAAVKTTTHISIANYFWLALVLLFLAERWFAHQTKNLTKNG
ncbi:MAG: hypothetical protein JWP44_2175 [Mucilaginibacter sp.]|nr:hypothetical protein [Mucilaginibacter sp.]